MSAMQKLLPASEDCEKGFLCSFLMAPDCGQIAQNVGMSAEWFVTPANAALYEILISHWHENEPFDLILITQKAHDSGRLGEIGGVSYITGLAGHIPTPAHATNYAETLREKFTQRMIITRADRLARTARDNDDDAAALVASFQRSAAEVAEAWRWRRAQRKTNSEVVAEIMHDFRSGDRQAVFGRSVGMPELDEKIGGLMDSDLLIIAGGPSSGKSALALQISEAWQRIHGQRVDYFTYEMKQRQQLHRLIQQRSGQNLRAAFTSQKEFADHNVERYIDRGAADASHAKISFIDDCARGIGELASEARRRNAQERTGLIVADYDELLADAPGRGETQETALAKVAFGMKQLGSEIGCPTILLSQITMDDKGNAKMRGSSAKLQAGNIVLFVERVGDDESKRTIRVWKNREGQRGAEIPLGFDGKTTRFHPLET